MLVKLVPKTEKNVCTVLVHVHVHVHVHTTYIIFTQELCFWIQNSVFKNHHNFNAKFLVKFSFNEIFQNFIYHLHYISYCMYYVLIERRFSLTDVFVSIFNFHLVVNIILGLNLGMGEKYMGWYDNNSTKQLFFLELKCFFGPISVTFLLNLLLVCRKYNKIKLIKTIKLFQQRSVNYNYTNILHKRRKLIN